ncbi:hypothetical protein [Mycobacterium asiaticum]|uniref:Integral membrane protein n=1 Tax=Mycobacterium asiaticum TaxID=1790 RepID=A0A1A3N1T4_MYCAS|nr:hypothetical protein [Mycobacterium asiaticum]OBK14337.1 hypothetical protein A5636_08165 [Mycobacterium asiaticum]
MLIQSGGRVLSLMLGVLMVAAATVGQGGPALALGAAAILAVGLGTIYRPASTVAVSLTAMTLLFSDASHVLAAVSGLSAAGYLAYRYAMAGENAWNGPTTVAAVGFTFAGLVATSFPLQVPWLPLIAPLAVLAIYVLATRPFIN